MIELRAADSTESAAVMMNSLASSSPLLSKMNIDETFSPVSIPCALDLLKSTTPGFESSFDVDGDVGPTQLIRGTMDESDLLSFAQGSDDAIVGVYADPVISEFVTCGGSAPVGTDKDVERLLSVPDLKARGMTGEGVLVAIVDTGVNMAYLASKGKTPKFDASRSWAPRAGLVPGSLPVSHGTMCAYDVCIAAPKCTLLDIALLMSNTPGGSAMDGLLSDAVRAYSHLRNVWKSYAARKALVVNNSWGMFQPSWDFPVGHPGNYSDNPNHPFNRIVATLEREGADILFAAGNCGNECPDGRCGGIVNAIYGANSHSKVITVGGVDTNNQRVGYSTKGPGRLFRNKPDVCGYTHFRGSGVYAADSGTSAATPVVAGLVAALRTRRPYRPLLPATWPSAVRTFLIRSAIDKGSAGFDFAYGWGIVNGRRVAGGIVLSQSEKDDNLGTETSREQSGVTAADSTERQSPDECSETPMPVNVESAGNIANLYFRLSRDAAPGRNIATITGLPPGTKTVSAWVTEWSQPNNSHAGGAFYTTSSVQLYDNGTRCRIVFNLGWNSHLPTGVQMMIGS
jgi:subtilisin family serine protease